jgi:hypothetical protein
MSDLPMTLIERLRNPDWERHGGPYEQSVLVTGRTRKDMEEAATEIERLQKIISQMTDGVNAKTPITIFTGDPDGRD